MFVRVTPNASQDEISGIVQSGEAEFRLAIKVRAVPDKGKANKAVIALLAHQLGIAKSDISLIHGTTSRLKTLRIEAPAQAVISELGRIN